MEERREQQHAPGGPEERAESIAALAGVDRALVEDHLERMDEQYLEGHDDRQVAEHVRAIAGLGDGAPCRVLQRQLGRGLLELTVVAFDQPGLFSVIAGLLAAEGLSIERGEVWTYAGSDDQDQARPPRTSFDFRRRSLRRAAPPAESAEEAFRRRKKIVDSFTVRPLAGEPDREALERRLGHLAGLLGEGRVEEARALVSRLVVEYLARSGAEFTERLLPVRVEVDNSLSPRYTAMDIEGEDTPAFLYLFTNALAMRRVDIHSILIRTTRGRVQDRLLITGSQGEKLVRPERIDELKFTVALVKQFSHLLVRSPDPAMALSNFDKLVERIYREQQVEGGWKLLNLTEQPVMEALARLFGMSNFLWEDFLRLQYENLVPVLADLGALDSYKDKAEMWSECEMELLGAASWEEAAERLNRFKDREMFRIDMRHILDKIDSFTEFSRELTDLAEVVIEEAIRICHSALQARYGRPLLEDGSPCRFAAFALGKAGGRELGYASDIELLLAHSGPGRTDGPEPTDNREYFEKLVQRLIQIIRVKHQGIFELDLRFRPYGNQGPLSSAFGQLDEYYREGGPAWDFERQCLVRLRFIAGDRELGERVLALRDRFVYSGRPLNMPELARLRRRQLEEFVKPGTWNAKFSRGALVDIEYHVQHLVVRHGAADPAVREPGTRQALKALFQGGYLGREEYESLREAHDFLRRLINALRILRGNARDLVVPGRAGQEFVSLARRMGYPPGRESRLAEDLVHHRTRVLRLVDWERKIREYQAETGAGRPGEGAG